VALTQFSSSSIAGCLSLRPPQRISQERLDRVTEIAIKWL
jgi:hypothetical protein